MSPEGEASGPESIASWAVFHNQSLRWMWIGPALLERRERIRNWEWVRRIGIFPV